MTFSAVLLAGGESRRMGRDKATVSFRGRSLWQWQLRTLQNLAPAKIFISARTKPSWWPAETELILDEPPSRGPLSGLTKTLTRMQSSHLVVLAVDMPFMTSPQMQVICGLAAIGRGVIPMIGGRFEPLAAIYPREADADLFAALSGDNFSLQEVSRTLVEADKLRIFPVPPGKKKNLSKCKRAAPGDLPKALETPVRRQS